MNTTEKYFIGLHLAQFQGSTYRSSMSAMERWAKLRGPVVGGAPHVLRLLRAHEKRWV